jgi:hypothetical protein
MVRINMLAGKGDAALEWLKLAKRGAVGMPAVASDLQNIWPLLVLSGLESDKDYAADYAKWLDAALKPTDTKATDNRTQREQAAAIMLLLDAAGFNVPDDSWAKVADAPVFEKHLVASALVPQRLRAAGTDNHRGESVLMALLLAGGEPSLANTVETVRALRLVGLTADAALLARETAVVIVTPVASPAAPTSTPVTTPASTPATPPALPIPAPSAPAVKL